jgi:hypothetical protein
MPVMVLARLNRGPASFALLLAAVLP